MHQNTQRFLNPQEKQEIIEDLIKSAISVMDVAIIDFLQTKYPTESSVAIGKLNDSEGELLSHLLSYDNHDFLSNTMRQFIEFGRIKIDGGLIAIAEMSQRKEYDVNPTILNNSEFNEYLSIIKHSSQPPIKEKFIITGTHWISGEIFISADGKAKILFVDSLGEKSTWLEEHKQDFTTVFPEGTIYTDATTRQHSLQGCSVFAINDIRHLYTIDNYLPKRADDPEYNLFKYLEENTYKVDGQQHYARLPLPFMLSTQTSQLYKDKPADKDNPLDPSKVKKAIVYSYPESQLKFKLGKQKPNGEELFKLMKDADHFIYDDGSRSKVNIKLEKKLDKMRSYVLKYLLDTPYTEVNDKMKNFTLQKFKEKLMQGDKTALHRRREG